MNLEKLKPQVEVICSSTKIDSNSKLTQICQLLQSNVSYYNWVGFYFANPTTKTLHLKAFAGTPTDHTEIPFGKGICGQVALSNKNFVVPNVKDQDNYISCSIDVKSEIVIPLFKNQINIGQIDIDSHYLNPFNEEDERFLEWVNQQVAKIL